MPRNNEKPFSCDIPNCGKSFSRRSDLVRHNRIHTNDRPFICPYDGCERDFIQRSALTVHIRVHTGERPHKCEWEGCDKAFADSSSLARHRRIHTGKRPYECPECDRNFCRKTTLLRHVERTHPNADLPDMPLKPQSNNNNNNKRRKTSGRSRRQGRYDSDDDADAMLTEEDEEEDRRRRHSPLPAKRSSGRVPRVSYRQYTDTPSPSSQSEYNEGDEVDDRRSRRSAHGSRSSSSRHHHSSQHAGSRSHSSRHNTRPNWSDPAGPVNRRGADPYGEEGSFYPTPGPKPRARMTIVSQECHCAAHPDPHVHEILYDGDEEYATAPSASPSPRMSYAASESYSTPATRASASVGQPYDSYAPEPSQMHAQEPASSMTASAPVAQREFTPALHGHHLRASSVPAFEPPHPQTSFATSPGMAHIGLGISQASTADYTNPHMRLEEEHELLEARRYPSNYGDKDLNSPRLFRTPSMSFHHPLTNSQSGSQTHHGHHLHHKPSLSGTGFSSFVAQHVE